MNSKSNSVILLSGGLDSAANLLFCTLTDSPALALTADYGQRAANPEMTAAKALCHHYGVPHAEVNLRWLGMLGKSALTDPSLSLPELGRDRLDDLAAARETARAVWIPNRNGVLIQVAAAYAEALGARRVVVGFNREEAATFPDNSTSFIEACNAALAYSTGLDSGPDLSVQVYCYTDQLNKIEILRRALKADPGFPLDLIWSCYRGGPHRCGRCESCERFGRALEGAKARKIDEQQ